VAEGDEATKIERPRPHYLKLSALSKNPKLPDADRPKLEEALEHYKTWCSRLSSADGDAPEILSELVSATNEYKRFIELDLIFDSTEDFLYRQKGQLKLDNTVMEEFLPHLVDQRLVPGLSQLTSLMTGPQKCFSGLYMGPAYAPLSGGGVFLKTKDQDFTVAREIKIRVSEADRPSSDFEVGVPVAYFVSELKTNLDKTMYQEAAATAQELKTNVPEAVYVLLCEWLDMPPIDTKLAQIDEVILLRKAKRLGSGVRADFSSAKGRAAARDLFEKHISDNPVSEDSIARLLSKLNDAFPVPVEESVTEILKRGYF
jgi:hypothetical protein